jgi:hypothetical protein
MGGTVMGAHSRRKGAGGEIEAAALLSVLTGKPWERTAQRSGKAMPDVWLADPVTRVTTQIHVEVKRYQGGLAWWTRRVVEQPEALFVNSATELYFCAASALPRHAAQQTCAELAPRQKGVVRWIAQAERDAAPDCTPLVLCRQDHAPWIAVWRVSHDDALMDVWREVCA